jgi:hypothetical protein
MSAASISAGRTIPAPDGWIARRGEQTLPVVGWDLARPAEASRDFAWIALVFDPDVQRLVLADDSMTISAPTEGTAS